MSKSIRALYCSLLTSRYFAILDSSMLVCIGSTANRSSSDFPHSDDGELMKAMFAAAAVACCCCCTKIYVLPPPLASWWIFFFLIFFSFFFTDVFATISYRGVCGWWLSSFCFFARDVVDWCTMLLTVFFIPRQLRSLTTLLTFHPTTTSRTTSNPIFATLVKICLPVCFCAVQRVAQRNV